MCNGKSLVDKQLRQTQQICASFLAFENAKSRLFKCKRPPFRLPKAVFKNAKHGLWRCKKHAFRRLPAIFHGNTRHIWLQKEQPAEQRFFYFHYSAGHFQNDILQCYGTQSCLYAITASRLRLDNQPNLRKTNLTMRKLVGIATQYTGTGASTALTPNQMKRFSKVICRR